MASSVGIQEEIEKAMNPKRIYKSEISLYDLENLLNDEEIVIQHPIISDIEITIGKEVKIEGILNTPVVFYGVKKQIKDNLNKVFPVHRTELTDKEVEEYVNQLLKCEDKATYLYYRSLKEKGLEINDIIEFEDGKQGVVCLFADEFTPNIRYIPLKKDGTLGKSKPRIVYGGVIYKVIRKFNAKE